MEGEATEPAFPSLLHPDYNGEDLVENAIEYKQEKRIHECLVLYCLSVYVSCGGKRQPDGTAEYLNTFLCYNVIVF
jgi:hypothetical protein